MLKTRTYSLFSILIVALLMLPLGLQLAHILENHEHKVCDSEEIQHIHKQKLDCSIYHVKLRTESLDLNINNAISVEIVKNNTPLFLVKESEYNPQKNVTTRGPPLFVI